jgi:hypothetical protein
METVDMIVLGLLVLLIIILILLISKNSKLSKENAKLREILAIKDISIANYEASRVAVTDVIENFSLSDKVMACIEAGESRLDISQKLNIPLAKIELVIKFNAIKNRH